MRVLDFFFILCCCTLLIPTVHCKFVASRSRNPVLQKPQSDLTTDTAHTKIKTQFLHKIISLRGGVTKKSKKITGPKPKTLISKAKDFLDQVKPATRAYLLLALFCSVVHMTGLPAPALFSLDMSKIYEVWRPLTAVAYLGAPSMSMANSLYFLLQYGQTLEKNNGTAEHSWFLILQTAMLTALGFLLGFPFQSQAMIAAIVYVCSRVSPMEKIPIQFGIVVTAWQLPYCMMILDCLSQQSPAAAWPHVLGIFTGHVYHFFTKVWPSLGGRSWLTPPAWFVDKLGGPPGSNIPGVDFRRGKKFDKREQQKKLFANKKGRKL